MGRRGQTLDFHSIFRPSSSRPLIFRRLQSRCVTKWGQTPHSPHTLFSSAYSVCVRHIMANNSRAQHRTG